MSISSTIDSPTNTTSLVFDTPLK